MSLILKTKSQNNPDRYDQELLFKDGPLPEKAEQAYSAESWRARNAFELPLAEITDY